MYIDGEMSRITLPKILGCDQSKRAIGAGEPLCHVTRVLGVSRALNRYVFRYTILSTPYGVGIFGTLESHVYAYLPRDGTQIAT